MAIINKTYFFNEIGLPIGNMNVANALEAFLIQYELEYLQKSMSYAFWKLFSEHLADTDGRWYDLLNGGEYYDAEGVLQQFEGLAKKGRTPIAPYVYYWFRRMYTTDTSSMGEDQGDVMNSGKISPHTKMARGWNLCSEYTCKLWDYLRRAEDESGERLFPEFDINIVNTNFFEPIPLI